MARLLDNVESGEQLTGKQLAYHEKTKVRDLALLTLFLGTGIRVSECVGLNIDDIDLKNNGIKIIRKGGNEVIVYFGDEVLEALLPYLEERKQIAGSARTYKRPVSFDAKEAYVCSLRGKSGKKIRKNRDHHEKHYAS